jgi:hypothetical protein
MNIFFQKLAVELTSHVVVQEFVSLLCVHNGLVSKQGFFIPSARVIENNLLSL